jgi:hypothetical protein
LMCFRSIFSSTKPPPSFWTPRTGIHRSRFQSAWATTCQTLRCGKGSGTFIGLRTTPHGGDTTLSR